MLRRPDQLITLKTYSLQFDTGIIRKLLYIGVPSSIETSIFQIGKLLVLSVVAGFGTSATTANAVSNSLSQFALIPAAAIGTAMITISGQCIGAGAYDLAVSYTKKLLLLSHGILAATNLIMFFACPYLLPLYSLTPETLQTATLLIRVHSIGAIFLYPESFMLTNTLRAAADVKYPMVPFFPCGSGASVSAIFWEFISTWAYSASGWQCSPTGCAAASVSGCVSDPGSGKQKINL